MAFELDLDAAEIRNPKLGAGEHAVQFQGFEYIETNFRGKKGLAAKFSYCVAQSSNPGNPYGGVRVVLIHGMTDTDHVAYGQRVGEVVSACMTITGDTNGKAALERTLSGEFNEKAQLFIIGTSKTGKDSGNEYFTYTYSPYVAETQPEAEAE